jgi:putative transposase
VRALQDLGLSQKRACDLVGQCRRTLHYRAKPKADAVFCERIQRLAEERPRWGWRRLLVLLRREQPMGEFMFRRLYRKLGLQVRPRKKRKVRYTRGNTIASVARPNERWSVDFMHDRLGSGRTYRTMNVVDDFTRECLAIDVSFSFGSKDVIRCFESISFDRGFPESLRFDNGSEFTSRAMLQWAAEKEIDLQFIQPGKPTQNANIESLNGRIRDELLNAHTFLTIFEAQDHADAWRDDYNQIRPHSALDYRTPGEFAAGYQSMQPSQLSAA